MAPAGTLCSTSAGSMYEAYGTLARTLDDATAIAGRYAGQAEAERLIVDDIAPKLALEPQHSLLEIGCGMGNLLVPLSFRVRLSVGMDHPDVIDKARRRFDDPRLEWIGGQFPQTKPDRQFERILIYSVVQNVASAAESLDFIEAAASLLVEGGRLLVGDLPNADKRRRFLGSESGRAFDAAWRAGQARTGASQIDQRQGEILSTGTTVTIDDRLVLDAVMRLRARGFDAWLMPQDPRLPFGRTREDLLIVRP